MLCWRFHFEKKFSINCLFTRWKWTYIYIYIYIGFWTLKLKCTQYGLYGRATFKNAKVGPGSGDQGFGFFGIAPTRRSDACNTCRGYLESPVATTRGKVKLLIAIERLGFFVSYHIRLTPAQGLENPISPLMLRFKRNHPPPLPWQVLKIYQLPLSVQYLGNLISPILTTLISPFSDVWLMMLG
jgi:hypothetical protein